MAGKCINIWLCYWSVISGHFRVNISLPAPYYEPIFLSESYYAAALYIVERLRQGWERILCLWWNDHLSTWSKVRLPRTQAPTTCHRMFWTKLRILWIIWPHSFHIFCFVFDRVMIKRHQCWRLTPWETKILYSRPQVRESTFYAHSIIISSMLVVGFELQD